MTSTKTEIIKLKQHIHKNFPELKAGFYISRRSSYVHMGIDEPLFSFTNKCLFKENLSNKFLVNYPYLIPRVK